MGGDDAVDRNLGQVQSNPKTWITTPVFRELATIGNV
jgi:hypothetical protein